MNSVVYVIVEDSVKEEITICSALLRSVLRIDCNEYQYEAELLDKCSNHPSGAQITISREIFSVLMMNATQSYTTEAICLFSSRNMNIIKIS